MTRLSQQLAQKLAQSKMVIEDALDSFSPENCIVAWSGGKDSTLLLWLIIAVCKEKTLEIPKALDIDQKDAFEEIIAFRDRIAREWKINLDIACNQDLLDKVSKIGDLILAEDLNDTNRQALANIEYPEPDVKWQPGFPVCNHLLKTVPINQYIIDHDISAMFTGIRWDEHGARENETYFSERDIPPHTRIHPLLHFTERDIWDATFALDIPYNNLYQLGFRSLDTKHGTMKQSDVPAWEQDLDNTSERGGRSEEKEKMMAQLRAWGYM